jgi:hypothetical protein
MSEVTRVRALCCECGFLRTVSRCAHLRAFMGANIEPPTELGRFTCNLKCGVCKAVTRHAVIRYGEPPQARNFAEREDYARNQFHSVRPR